MKELILVKNKLKAELALQEYVLEQWKKNYEKQKLESTLQQIRYVEGIIDGYEKSIKRIEDFICATEKGDE